MQKPRLNSYPQIKATIQEKKRNIKDYASYIAQKRKTIRSTPNLSLKDIEKYNNDIANHSNSIRSWGRDLAIQYKALWWNLIITDRQADNYQVIDFVPKKVDLSNLRDLSRKGIDEALRNMKDFSVNSYQRGTYAKVQDIHDRYWNATHQLNTYDEKTRYEAVTSFRRFDKLITELLKTDIDRAIENEVMLFDFPISRSNLSDGQKILLQFCLALHSHEGRLEEIIVFMDEPENHIHPAQLIDVVDRIRKIITNGQLWIATHSIPLLSHFDPSKIWYMEQGKVSYSGKEPETVLTGLVGDEDRIEKMKDFLGLPAVLASNQFAYECLFAPGTAEYLPDDPQGKQIAEVIQNIVKEKGSVNVLDYGAGQGRLLDAIYYHSDEKEKIKDWLDYYAFDPYSNDAKLCRRTIENVFGEGHNRYFNCLQELQCETTTDYFDIVIMCNVFHEIDPNNWLVTFGKNGNIYKLLNGQGQIMIVEDQLIPIGEKAYQKGFIVFDELQFKTLFQWGKGEELYSVLDARGDNRLKAHFIGKELLGRIDGISRKEAIREHISKAKDELKKLRSEQPTYKKGKLHGFWSQQLANATLVDETL